MKKLLSLLVLSVIAGCTTGIPDGAKLPVNTVKTELITKIIAKVNSDETKKLLINNVQLDTLSIEQLQELDNKISQPVSPTASSVPTGSPSPSVTPLPVASVSPVMPSPQPTASAQANQTCVGGQGLPCIPVVPEKYNPPYSTAKPVSPTMRSGSVNVTFKDEFKVRYNKEQKIFISQTGQDVTGINNLLKEYKVKEIGSNLGGITQEQADLEERQIEANLGYDFPNYGSMYMLVVEDINVKELVDKLRANNLVREANGPENVVTF